MPDLQTTECDNMLSNILMPPCPPGRKAESKIYPKQSTWCTCCARTCSKRDLWLVCVCTCIAHSGKGSNLCWLFNLKNTKQTRKTMRRQRMNQSRIHTSPLLLLKHMLLTRKSLTSKQLQLKRIRHLKKIWKPCGLKIKLVSYCLPETMQHSTQGSKRIKYLPWLFS